jgi:trehalose 6-phosphate synthase
MTTAPPDRPIVLASNRGPVSFQRDDAGQLVSRRGAGGLISGIGPLMSEAHATWLASAITDGDREAAAGGVVEADGFRVHMLAVDAETYRLAYDVVSNGVLWFAHHGLWDLTREPAFDATWPDAWAAYRALNGAFATAIADDAPEGALVLVQDYHLCLVAAELADARPDLRCVHFTHTPFAPPVWLSPLPDPSARELLEGMAAYRACGFHTSRWADDFHESSLQLAGRAPRTFVAPLASDPEDIRAEAASPACASALLELDEVVGDRLVIGRVDRVELSKNILRGFLAYDDLLARHPEHRERVVFVAGAYPSREGVEAYARYRADVERTVEEINERWGTPDWQPIVLEVEDDFPRSVAVLRRADVLLVNPIRDGLNLVASEAALVNERDAVLALSPEAGAWEQLHLVALQVPPFDVAGTGDVLHRALTMPAEERHRRATELRSLAESRTPRDWLHDQRVAGG